MPHYDVIIIGAGAAGMMCAATAGQRGRSVLLLDHGKKIGEKIRIAGGGRCNFTNIHARPEAFLSGNPHFCKSALSRYTQHDFIALVEAHGIAWHEKTLGQLFCDHSSQQIIDMLLNECAAGDVTLMRATTTEHVEKRGDNDYRVTTDQGDFTCESLVIATGGLSIPKLGASDFGYKIAEQFNLNVNPPAPALVPLTFTDDVLNMCKQLTGVSVEASVTCGDTSFAEGLLFTHRGLSGPSILQISSYWQPGRDLIVDLARGVDITAALKQAKNDTPKQDVHTSLGQYLPQRLAEALCERAGLSGRIAEKSNADLARLGEQVNRWRVRPAGSEGYRTAEVTLYGIDTNELSSKTMECKSHQGLYFIGEVVDVTGHLGGYNFQWAWASGYVAGQYV